VDNTQGNLQALPNGNWFVGWGGTGRNVSEFSAVAVIAVEGSRAELRGLLGPDVLSRVRG
ncbi:hypothetical protein AB0L40_12680, partial [Patulibacter sp. NPDC049589]|uniref:hypothetical protein n=1 Tax=Patulibacter sp. NPDC049589 TaxID=3154731 RepID=UPI00342A645E